MNLTCRNRDFITDSVSLIRCTDINGTEMVTLRDQSHSISTEIVTLRDRTDSFSTVSVSLAWQTDSLSAFMVSPAWQTDRLSALQDRISLSYGE
jgi:hypothetical protein